MALTLHALTALRVMRAIRAGTVPGSFQRRCEIPSQTPTPPHSWTRKRVVEKLAFLGEVASFTEKRPLDLLVADKSARIRTKGVRCSYRMGSYPGGAFVDLGHDVAISGPELTFVELSRIMDPAVHLLLGMELCGRFSRDALDPRNGTVTYGIEPVTTVERLRNFAQEAHWIRGAEQALVTIDRIVENAWSPMEALIATLLALPANELGYDLWPIALNPRKELNEELARLSDVHSRVPDVMFRATNVGLNYDGEDHFKLRNIARTAVEADRHPEDSSYEQALEGALAEARSCIVADKRRDRDLMALGLVVFSVTKEDLEESGGFDRLIGQVIEAIEAEGVRDLSAQRRHLRNRSHAEARQELIWSLMPSRESAHAHKRLAKWQAILDRLEEYDITFTTENGEVRIVSLEQL